MAVGNMYTAALANAIKADRDLEGSVAVVLIDGNPKRYSYYIPDDGEKYEKGDNVIVPVEVGGPLNATIIFISKASRYTTKATKEILYHA